MYQQTGNGFLIEGPMHVSYEHGISIDRMDLCELLQERLNTNQMELALGRVRMTVEVLSDE